MTVEFRPSVIEDVPLLAEMYQQLMIDEGNPNTLPVDALETKIRHWLENEYRAILIYREADMVGYLLYRSMFDDDVDRHNLIYVRQFFIKRTYRRRGIGQVAFEALTSAFFPPESTIILDVLASNPEGMHFWHKLGFDSYKTTLRRKAAKL